MLHRLRDTALISTLQIVKEQQSGHRPSLTNINIKSGADVCQMMGDAQSAVL